VGTLIEGSDVNLKDEKYTSPPLGWAIHGCYNPPAGNQGRQRVVLARLIAAGARVEAEWLESEQVRGDSVMLAALLDGKL
jgi:hypothetical protein